MRHGDDPAIAVELSKDLPGLDVIHHAERSAQQKARYRVVSRIALCVALTIMRSPARLLDVNNMMLQHECLRQDPTLDIPVASSSDPASCTDTRALANGCLSIIKCRQG